MRLQEAGEFVLPITHHAGRTVADICKTDPQGIVDLYRLYWTGRIGQDLREVLRSVFAAPKAVPWLTRKLGSTYRQDAYLLPAHGRRCRCCGGERHPERMARLCPHNRLTTHYERLGCPCGSEPEDGPVREGPDRCLDCNPRSTAFARKYPLFRDLETKP